MPELPEVEIIRRGLAEKLPGRVVQSVSGQEVRVFLTPLPEIEARLPGQAIVSVERRGKFLILRLESEALVIHLGMTGQVTFWDRAADDSPGFLRHPKTGLQSIRQHTADQHTHLIVRFSDGNRLHYRDPRKFGKIRRYSAQGLEHAEPLAQLGPEPLGPQWSLTRLEGRLKKTRRVIKAALLDQGIAAGVGNIYADEALFRAGIRPTRVSARLSRREIERLWRAIPEVLESGIAFRGTSFRDYIDSDGAQGSNQEQLMVYGRAHEPCRHCGAPIRKIVLTQRGTHYCPRCQRRGARAKPQR